MHGPSKHLSASLQKSSSTSVSTTSKLNNSHFDQISWIQSSRQTITRTPITYRALSTTSRTHAIKPEPTTRASVNLDSSSVSSSPSTSTPEAPSGSPASSPTPKEDTLESLGGGSISQALSWIQPDRNAPSHFKSSSAQMENQATSPDTFQSPRLRSSSLLNSLSNSAIKNPLSGLPRYPGSESPFGRMQYPNKKAGDSSATEFMKATSAVLNPPLAPRVEMRLSPRTGRTVDIKSNIDLSRGIRMLEASCALNKVRHDQTHQRFHERGGMKRKRLRRQRWRNNFMEGFKGIVSRVKQLKNQGW
ncbi:hypothetical protein EYC80_008255 [Monilinia laxa]|uniref:Ribosomal protein S21 n=1 Tax=Monilinia laxa TaxID=61186 RepID=A0A5N6JVC5_MONLA|nr:hypothetical protein EYC80_008255 [Monilinia laxa]